jgi:hypothetical protein
MIATVTMTLVVTDGLTGVTNYEFRAARIAARM